MLKTDKIVTEVLVELGRARDKFPRPQASAHEGFAVLDEERDELWDDVKGNHGNRTARMRAKAIQIAAMAIRFIEDVCDAEKAPPASAEREAEWMIRQLGKEDLLYSHHAGVCARPAAYTRLGEMLESYARRATDTSSTEQGGSNG